LPSSLLTPNRLIVAERTGDLIGHHRQPSGCRGGHHRRIAGRHSPGRQLLGLKDPPPVRKFTVEKWSGGRMHVMEMSDERIRESREVTAGSRSVPCKRPPAPAAAPAKETQTLIPSGVVNPYSIVAMPSRPRPNRSHHALREEIRLDHQVTPLESISFSSHDRSAQSTTAAAGSNRCRRAGSALGAAGGADFPSVFSILIIVIGNSPP